MNYALDQVFNEAGLPEITYVQPKEALQLKGSLSTKGKHVTLVGPSGSGKSTVATKALHTLGFDSKDVLQLSGRTYSSFGSIFEVFGSVFGVAPDPAEIEPWLSVYKLIMIDDVHHLTLSARTELAKNLKLLARAQHSFLHDRNRQDERGDSRTGPELAIRNDSWHVGAQTNEFMEELLHLGEQALNVSFPTQARETAIAAAQGSPSILQAIARIACVNADVFGTQQEAREVPIELPLIRDAVAQQYDGRYLSKIVSLARGRRQARSVHDTYYNLVEQIAKSGKQQISRDELYHKIVGSEDARKKGGVATAFTAPSMPCPK